ncbi:quinone oxidoreductase [Bradyrhizobium sp. LHD-71]|uniref:quinone oxidoreductase family protein n=1 Tax=Bradyrhizobium sp. LHD-71 TaxID=3072141 RepID=UPI00280D1163|nr:quinone oxidoreductase [Bradyrhizobium sp. LHD-71]MDQ8728962.1 quinone oxidoreductase [Bradyrhizobium sp. LHD-71]
MKAVRVHQFGGPEVLTYEDVPDPPAPGSGQALVDMKIIGVNYSDTNYRRGFRMHQAVSLPLTPGHEGAGVVSAVGEGVTGVRPGDRVVFSGQHRLGTYKQKMLLPAVSLVPVPADFDLKLAVAVLNQGQTAHYLCHDAYEVKAGDRVLVHAGAGGVGSNLVQMTKMLGAYVYATVSSDDKADVARDLGADKVIVYTKIDFAEEIMKDTEGNGVHAIFDAIGGDVLPKGLTCLARRGHLLTYGQSAGPSPPFEWPPRGVPGSVYLSNHQGADYSHPGEATIRRAHEIFGWVKSGALKVHIHKEYPLADAVQAHRDLASRTTVGKLLLIP